MKILILIHSVSSGGAERVTANLANYWAEKGWQVTIVTMTATGHDFYQLHPDIQRIGLALDADSLNLLTSIQNNYRRISALRRVLQQQQPDIAQAMMTTANILLALAAKGTGIPVVGSERIHPPMFPLGRVWEWARRHIYGQLFAVTALTKQSAEWIKNNTRATSVPVIPNAVTWPLTPHPPRVDPESLMSTDLHLLAVGRLAPQKGFKRLLAAFAELAPRYPEWRLIILGEGECRQSLELQRAELGLEHQVFMPGLVGNLADWYTAADLYVMTSRFEGFPNTVMEAMAHGLPAVSVDCDTGPRDIIRHQVDGLLVPQNNHDALVESLATLMSNHELRQQYASRAIEVRERFSMEKIAGMWEELFEEIM